MKKYKGLALRDFSLGLNLASDPKALDNREVSDCQNVLFDKYPGVVVKREGMTLVSTLPNADLPVLRLFLYQKDSGTQIVIAQQSDFKIWWSIDRVTWTELVPHRGLAPFAPIVFIELCNFTIFDDMLWLSNKSDPVCIFDGTHTWVLNGDTYADTNGHVAPTSEALPYITPNVPKGKIILNNADRIFICNTVDNPSEIRFSNYYNDAGNDIRSYNKDAWPAVNQVAVAQDDGSQINSAYIFPPALTVFKDSGIYVVSGNNPLDIRIDKTSSTTGTLYHHSTKIFSNMLTFLGKDGIYSFVAGQSQKISRKLQEFFDATQQVMARKFSYLFSATEDFSLGQFPSATIDVSQNEIRQRALVAEDGTFPAALLSVSGSAIALKKFETASEWNTGVSTGLVVADGSVTLQTESYSEYSEQPFAESLTTQFNAYNEALYTLSAPAKITTIRVFISDGSLVTWEAGSMPTQYGTWYAKASLYTGLWEQWNPALGRSYRLFEFRSNMSIPNFYNGASVGFEGTFLYLTIFTRYVSSGSLVMPAVDFGVTPETFGKIAVDFAIAGDATFTIQTRASDDNVTWDAWTTQTNNTNITSTARRYLQVQFLFASPVKTGGATSYTPTLKKMSLSAMWHSADIDFGYTPSTYGKLLSSSTLPAGTALVLKTRSSDDGATWDAWLETDTDGNVQSALRRHLQVSALLTPADSCAGLPSIASLGASYAHWRSPKIQLNTTPATWGKLDADVDNPTVSPTFWIRSASSSDLIDEASWVQLAAGAQIAGIALAPWVQIEIRFAATALSAPPKVYAVSVNYFNNNPSIQEAVAWVYRDYLLFSLMAKDAAANDTIFVVNKSGVFSKFRGWNVASFCDYGPDLLAGSSTSGKIYQLFTGYNDAGAAIDAWLAPKALNFGFPDNQKLVRFAWLNANQPVAGTLQYLYHFDDQLEQGVNYAFDAGSVNNARLVFPAGTKGKVLYQKIQNNIVDEQMHFVGIEFYYDLLPLRKLSPVVATGGTLIYSWSALPAAIEIGKRVYLADVKGDAQYLGAGKWRILSGEWTTATRPSTANLAAGSRGFNTDPGVGAEMWDGTNWIVE